MMPCGDLDSVRFFVPSSRTSEPMLMNWTLHCGECDAEQHAAFGASYPPWLMASCDCCPAYQSGANVGGVDESERSESICWSGFGAKDPGGDRRRYRDVTSFLGPVLTPS